jgi:hypothetical protein
VSASNRPDPAPDGSTTERLVDQLRERHWLGLKKYGTTLDRTDLDVHQWIQHLREELLDGLGYLQRVDDCIRMESPRSDRIDSALIKIIDRQKARIAELEKQFAERG